MQDLETEIIAWFMAQHGAANPALSMQLASLEVTARQFSGGGGVFLSVGCSLPSVSRWDSQVSYIDGPELQSSELAAGALVTLHFQDGLASSIEIWSYASDYPMGAHPTDFTLIEPDINFVDLRVGKRALRPRQDS